MPSSMAGELPCRRAVAAIPSCSHVVLPSRAAGGQEDVLWIGAEEILKVLN